MRNTLIGTVAAAAVVASYPAKGQTPPPQSTGMPVPSNPSNQGMPLPTAPTTVPSSTGPGTATPGNATMGEPAYHHEHGGQVHKAEE